MKTYTLWLMPDSHASEEMQIIIDSYSSKLNYSVFKPHLTLLGSIEFEEKILLSQLETLLSQVSPVQLQVNKVSLSTTYFQSVYAHIEPNPELLDLHIKLRKKFTPESTLFFMPHISLLYADISSAEKYTIAKKITLKNKTFVGNRVVVITAPAPDPKTWIEVAEFKLNKTQ